VANRKKSHRPRSRKPRPDGPQISSEPSSQASGPRPKGKPRAAERSRRAPSATTRTYGERPQAPWHPLPLSELLIVVGAVGAWIGLNRGVSHGGPPLFVGLAAVLIGTVEVTLREHRGGYRSHTMLLSLLPVVVFHTLVVLVVTAFTHLPPLVNLALLGVDLALFALLFRLWRARFVDARRVRAFGGR
jgi:hypothetical protein